jgi:hypothetical protein
VFFSYYFTTRMEGRKGRGERRDLQRGKSSSLGLIF